MEEATLLGESRDAVTMREEHQLTLEFTTAKAAELEGVLQALPAFADDENRGLNAALIAKRQAIAIAAAEARDHADRLTVMRDHLRSVRQEMVHAQELLEARRKERASEEHALQLAQRTAGRGRHDLVAMAARAAQVEAAIETAASQEAAISSRAAAVAGAAETATATADTWVEAAAAREEDERAVDAYARADSARISELRRELEAVTEALAAQRAAVAGAGTEARSKALEADRIGADFRAAHAERAALIKRWQAVLTTIQTRDADIMAAGEALAAVKEEKNARRKRLTEREGLLGRLVEGNVALERRAEAVRATTSLAREEQSRLSTEANALSEAVDTLKSDALAAAGALAKKQAECEGIAEQIQTQGGAVAAAEASFAAVQSLLEAATRDAGNAAAALAEKEAFLSLETKRAERVERENRVLAETLFKAKGLVNALLPEETTAESNLKGAKRLGKLLAGRLKEADAAAAAQAEHVYAAEYAVEAMERKLASMSGAAVTDEESAVLTVRIGTLRREVEASIATERAMEASVKEVHASLQAAMRRVAELRSDISVTGNALEEAALQNRAREEELKRASGERDMALVDHDLLRLEVRKLRDVLSERSEAVYSLENKAVELAAAVDARKKELGAMRMVQKATAKLLEEERHKLAVEVGERTIHVTNMRKRFELIAAKVRTTDGATTPPTSSSGSAVDGGGGGASPSTSQVQYIVRAAAQKAELNAERDGLVTAIATGEAELEALKLTLAHVTERNGAFRAALARADGGSEEMSAVKVLATAVAEASSALFRTKRSIAATKRASAADEASAGAASARVSELTRIVSDLRSAAACSLNDVRAAESEGKEAVSRLATATAEIRWSSSVSSGSSNHSSGNGGNANTGATGSGAPATPQRRETGDTTPDQKVQHHQRECVPEETHYASVGVKEATALVLYTLSQLGQQFPDLGESLGAELQRNASMKVPQRPPTRPGTSDSALYSSTIEAVAGEEMEAATAAAAAAAAAAVSAATTTTSPGGPCVSPLHAILARTGGGTARGSNRSLNVFAGSARSSSSRSSGSSSVVSGSSRHSPRSGDYIDRGGVKAHRSSSGSGSDGSHRDGDVTSGASSTTSTAPTSTSNGGPASTARVGRQPSLHGAPTSTSSCGPSPYASATSTSNSGDGGGGSSRGVLALGLTNQSGSRSKQFNGSSTVRNNVASSSSSGTQSSTPLELSLQAMRLKVTGSALSPFVSANELQRNASSSASTDSPASAGTSTSKRI